jgi:rhodanese-related sulfurtransferase
MKNRFAIHIVVGLIAAGLVVPVVLVMILNGSVPSIAPEEAERLLSDPKTKAILMDVRSEKEFNASGLKAAKNLPVEATSDRQRMDALLADSEKVLIICNTGLDGAWATRRLLSMGYRNVVNVAGGMDRWLSERSDLVDKFVRTRQGETRGVTLFSASLLDQIVITLSAFALKPLYQILSIVIIVLLWKRSDPDLTAIKWAMIAFFIGENACAANYLIFNENSLLMEYLHMYGMLLCFGLVVYAFMVALDKRILHFSERDKKCTLLSLCGRCYKYSSVTCNLRSFYLLIIPATVVLATIPLSGSLGHRFYEGTIFGNTTTFGQPIIYQFLEARVFPAVSLIFFATAMIVIIRSKEDGFGAAKRWYAMGMGLLGFSLMRFFIYWGYQDRPLWADAWEEITEFLFIILLLWIALRVRSSSRITLQDSVKA